MGKSLKSEIQKSFDGEVGISPLLRGSSKQLQTPCKQQEDRAVAKSVGAI